MKSAIRTAPRGRPRVIVLDLEKKVELLRGSKASVEFVAQYGQDLHAVQGRIDDKVDAKLDKYGEKLDTAVSQLISRMDLLQTSVADSQAKLQTSVADSQAKMQASFSELQSKTNESLVKTQASIDTGLATGVACFLLPMALWFVCEIIPRLATAVSAAKSSQSHGLLYLVVFMFLTSALTIVLAYVFPRVRAKFWPRGHAAPYDPLPAAP